MTKSVVIFLLVGVSAAVTAQENHRYPPASFDLFYGSRFYAQNFYGQLNTIEKQSFGQPLQIIGIGYSGMSAITRNANMMGHYNYLQVLPQSIQLQDSVSAKVTGFVFQAAFGKFIATKSGVLSLTYYLGFNTGRLRLYGNELARQKNPFFSPKAGIQPKVKLGDLALSVIVEYEYDVSNSYWRRTFFANNSKVKLESLRQTGLTAQLGIGYVIE